MQSLFVWAGLPKEEIDPNHLPEQQFQIMELVNLNKY